MLALHGQLNCVCCKEPPGPCDIVITDCADCPPGIHERFVSMNKIVVSYFDQFGGGPYVVGPFDGVVRLTQCQCLDFTPQIPNDFGYGCFGTPSPSDMIECSGEDCQPVPNCGFNEECAMSAQLGAGFAPNPNDCYWEIRARFHCHGFFNPSSDPCEHELVVNVVGRLPFVPGSCQPSGDYSHFMAASVEAGLGGPGTVIGGTLALS